MIKVMPDFLLLTENQIIFLLIVVFALLAISFLLLYLSEHVKNAKLSRHNSSDLEENQQKGYNILHDAIKKSQAIIGISELEGIKIEAEEKQAISKNTKDLEIAMTQATEDFKSYLDYLNKQADTTVAKNEEMLRQRVNSMIEKFEQNLSTFLTETQAQSSSAITLEMQAARALIQGYKNEQFKLIDENIVAMLERTLSLVLQKRLTLKEHVDLVYESLERAKLEKFIV